MVKKEEDESEKDAEKADKETEKGKPSKDRSSDSKRTGGWVTGIPRRFLTRLMTRRTMAGLARQQGRPVD